jgi:chromosome partitioning protein
MNRIIAVANQKGGVGKTTSTLNIGAGLSLLKRKVLLVDLDPQANLTYSVGIRAHELKQTIYDLLKDKVKVEDIIIKHKNYDIIPSNINLSGIEIELSTTSGREFVLKKYLSSVIEKYNYILIDCPPSLGLITLNGLTTSKEVFIPLQTEFLSLQGLSELIQTIEIVKHRLNHELIITGIIGTLFDSRKKLNKEVVEKIQEYFDGKLFKTLIRDNVALAEAPSFGRDIFEYKQNSHGAKDYINLCKEIISQEEHL